MKIIAIGRNYAAHASEMGNAVPDEPIVFMKPKMALLKNNMPFDYPTFSSHIDYETELVFRVSRNGKDVSQKEAENYYDQVGLGIDFTARDLQAKCKENGRPWEIAKAFDHSAAISNCIPLADLQNPKSIAFELKRNGEVVQQGNSEQMIFHVDQIVSYVSKFFTINIGDLIFTGTPKGVGPVKPGDLLEGYLDGKPVLQCEIKPPRKQN